MAFHMPTRLFRAQIAIERGSRHEGQFCAQPPEWLWWENLGQGLGFCNFRPGKLPHTGTFTSVRRYVL